MRTGALSRKQRYIHWRKIFPDQFANDDIPFRSSHLSLLVTAILTSPSMHAEFAAATSTLSLEGGATPNYQSALGMRS